MKTYEVPELTADQVIADHDCAANIIASLPVQLHRKVSVMRLVLEQIDRYVALDRSEKAQAVAAGAEDQTVVSLFGVR